ncbi:RING finger and CHY zinc finger domain-containing protein 1-like, partial [Trifolium pratense]
MEESHNNVVPVAPSETGSGQYGCSHYRRRCKIIAPCCNQIFDCRHCHNESQNSVQVDLANMHDIPRHDVKRVICSLCSTEQDVQQVCIQCGVCMGRYFCSKCKFFDDDVSKKQYHCDECGICRTGGEENFFHCKKCGKLLIEHCFPKATNPFTCVSSVFKLSVSLTKYLVNCHDLLLSVDCCYSSSMKDSHRCIEKAMHQNCPVCFEFLFDTTKDITVLPCGHTIHLGCVREMQKHCQYSCPVCSKSFCDMSRVWEKMDEELASTPMPEMFQNKMRTSALNASPTTPEGHKPRLHRACQEWKR